MAAVVVGVVVVGKPPWFVRAVLVVVVVEFVLDCDFYAALLVWTRQGREKGDKRYVTKEGGGKGGVSVA